MTKKIIIMMMMIIMLGCITEKGGIIDEENKNSTENQVEGDNIQKKGPYEVKGEVIDSNIYLEITSKPLENGAETVVEFQYKASQDGYSASDFEYTYELVGIETLEIDGLSNVYKFVDQINKKFYGLENGVNYTFQVWARNKKTEKISPSNIFSFTVKQEDNTKISDNISLDYIYTDKNSLNEGDEITLKIGVTNIGEEDLSVIPSIVFNTTTIYSESINENSSFQSGEVVGMEKIAAGETIEIEKIYTIQTGTVDGNSLDKLFYAIAKIEIPSEEKETESKSRKFQIYANNKMDINIDEVTVLQTEVTPGEQEIKIRYTISTFNNAEVLINDITPIIKKMDGTDVSDEWIDTNSGESKIITGVGYITRSYNLSPQATVGNMIVDATLTGIGENNFELTALHAEKGDTITVLDRGIADLDVWIAYPEGAVDGIVSENQEFTVYGMVSYNGSVKFSDYGEVELNIDNLDGVRIMTGTKKQQIVMNEQMQWTIKAGVIPIIGNIKMEIIKKPIEKETLSEIDFINTEKFIQLQVLEKPELELETGVEEDNYGGNDGVLRDNSEFEVYAIVTNINDNKISGDIKISLDLSGISGVELAPGEILTKSGTIDSKIIWILRTPIGNRTGSLRFNLEEVPEDVNTGENAEYEDVETLLIKVKHIGELNLQQVYCDWTEVDPGQSRIPIKFDIENNGDTDIRLIDVKVEFTSLGIDLGEKWTQTDTTINTDTLILGNTIQTITAYYKLKENIFDDTDILGSVTISGSVRGEEIISKEILEDLEPRMDDIIIVNDRIAPVAIASADITTAKVGEDIIFTGENSTDNNEIRYYSWDFDDSDEILESVRGEIIVHSYKKVGVYKVILMVNDIDNNGPATTEILITVTE